MVLGASLSIRADSLMSGFSPGENPFTYNGFFGSFAQNSDGTQTLFENQNAAFWSIYLQPNQLDATDRGKNLAISLRARREPDSTALGHFDLMENVF